MFRYIKTEEDVVDYIGVTPNKIPDLFGLMGDSSDGIPGVSGIGPKTGVQLINQYGDLESLYEHIDEINGKKKEKLLEERDNAFLSRKLATVHRDIDMEYDKEKLKLDKKDLEKLLIIYKTMEFKKFSAIVENELKKYENPLEVQITNIKSQNNRQISLFDTTNTLTEKNEVSKDNISIKEPSTNSFKEVLLNTDDASVPR